MELPRQLKRICRRYGVFHRSVVLLRQLVFALGISLWLLRCTTPPAQEQLAKKIWNYLKVYMDHPPYVLKRFALWDALAQARTFSMFSDVDDMNSIAVEHINLFVRSLLEERGYQYVEPDQHPDFWVSILAEIESDQAVAVGLYVRDSTGRLLWQGVQTGWRPRMGHDVCTFSQAPFLSLVEYIPPAAIPPALPIGETGIRFRVFTLDENHYFPIVTKVRSASPAAKEGVEEGDIIVAIDGQLVKNKSWLEVQRLLRGEPGTTVTLHLWRIYVEPQREGGWESAEIEYEGGYEDEQEASSYVPPKRKIPYGPFEFAEHTVVLQREAMGPTKPYKGK